MPYNQTNRIIIESMPEGKNSLHDLIKKTVLLILIWLARQKLKQTRPFIIGITGSIGKTTTKEAVFHLLQTKFKVKKNEGSYNTDFGLPLTVLNQKSGLNSMQKWFKILLKGLGQLFQKEVCQYLVLEMGADKPGDITFLRKIVTPQIAVVTTVAPVHLAEGQFKNLEEIAEEKSQLLLNLSTESWTILNHDDPRVLKMSLKTKTKLLTYGTSLQANLIASQIQTDLNGLTFTVSHKNEQQVFQSPLLGKHQIYTLLPAIAVGITQGFSLAEAALSFRKFTGPRGRFNLISGIKNSKIIDSSYNASPLAMRGALEFLAAQNVPRKIAVLGSLNELGITAEQHHRAIGQQVASIVTLLVTVGKQAYWIAESAQTHNSQPAHHLVRGRLITHHFLDPEEAGHWLKDKLKTGDLILVKGSQNNIRLEKLIKIIMAEPEKATELLVRQGGEWI
ncbi:hypothetical protein COT40_00510 [Candidatus Peregrinibacteria bacterium CG08_land_8_20_14_0_20_41_10]|nr:MAG: hypothetical protein COT40_00510 [Candidatus Peregrinibacteria bacterium CG08_land_8_20_14_0_20_41_10]